MALPPDPDPDPDPQETQEWLDSLESVFDVENELLIALQRGAHSVGSSGQDLCELHWLVSAFARRIVALARGPRLGGRLAGLRWIVLGTNGTCGIVRISGLVVALAAFFQNRTQAIGVVAAHAVETSAYLCEFIHLFSERVVRLFEQCKVTATRPRDRFKLFGQIERMPGRCAQYGDDPADETLKPKRNAGKGQHTQADGDHSTHGKTEKRPQV